MNIGQASEASGVSQRMIRHYEQMGVIPPPSRRDSGHRVYDEDDVRRLAMAAAAREIGFDIGEIKGMLGQWSGGAGHDDIRAFRAALERKAATIAMIDEALAELSTHYEADGPVPALPAAGIVGRAKGTGAFSG